MASMVGSSAGAGLVRSCEGGDWMVASRPADGVELLRAWFGGRAYARHRHDTYAISVTESGVQAFDYRGRIERSLPGEVVVLHPDEMHDGRPGTAVGFGYREVYVDPAWIAEAVRTITGAPGHLPFVRRPVTASESLAATVTAAFHTALEPLALDTVVLRLAEGLLDAEADHRVSRAPVRVDRPAVGRARAYLERHRTVVRSAELEAVSGLDRYDLARQFRAVHGTSPYRFSVLRRLDYARGRLGDGTPLAGIALDAGFTDQAHFTRMFRSAFGLTPGRYLALRRSAASPSSGRVRAR
jgi:AraC-like DNA-binding protein